MDYSQSQTSEEVDDIDPENYKGIFYNVEQENKYQDPNTGAHFRFQDMCAILTEIKQTREKDDIKTRSRQSYNEHYKSQEHPPANRKIIIIDKEKQSRNPQNNALPQQGFSSGDNAAHLSKVPVLDPFAANANTVDILNRKKTVQENIHAIGAKRLSAANQKKPTKNNIQQIITKILGPKSHNLINPKQNIGQNKIQDNIMKNKGRNSQWQFSTSNDVNPYHSRNNFFSFGDKKMIDAGLHRKLSVKQYTDKIEKPVHYAKSSLEQHSRHPVGGKKVMNNQLITSNYVPSKGKSYFGNNIKELYSKIQNMKSNLKGKRVIASRQASKQANHTTTDHKLDGPI